MFDSSHWYMPNGAPFYETKDAKGNLRSVTLRDARKVNAVPSVTTVLQCVAKPQLEAWKVRQGILAALTLPPIEGETEDAWLARIMKDSQQQAKDAAEEGTRIHDAIERSFRGLVVPQQYRPHVEGVRAKLADLFPGVTDWIPEQSFAHPLGYGGKVDLHSPATGIVVDFKGKDGDFTDGKKLAYDQHWQLAAYARGLHLPPATGANLFFSRTHPGAVAAHPWTPDDMAEGWQVFAAALALWQAMKGYRPAIPLQAAA